MVNFEELLKICEALLRAGKTQDVARHLHSLKPGDIPPEWRRSYASICRRAGLLTLGLKLLSPSVRDHSLPAGSRVQPADLAEYGALLWRVGAVSEALSVLESVDSREAPEALLYQAFCYFSQWEYSETLPILEMYLRAPINNYASLVGCVNLCAAFVGSRRYTSARELLNSNLELTRHGEFWRLHGNCLELSAQVHIAEGEFAKARLDLDRAAQLLSDNRITDELYIRKWRAILKAHESGDISDLRAFRAEAVQRENWESVREADLFMLKFKFDQEKFEHLIFGTPFIPYRERVMAELSRKPANASYIYGDPSGPVLDVATATMKGVHAEIRPGALIHRVIEALLKDLYRPIGLGAFFSALFPGEYFDPYSSPNRVHQLVRRTRKWFERNGFPVAILSTESGYNLKITGPFAFRLPLEHSPISRHQLQWDKIVAKFSRENFFTAHEGRHHLGMPPTSFKRLIRWAVDQHLVEKRGGGSNVIYKFRDAA